MSLTYFKTLATYNTWANRKMARYVLDAGEEVCLAEQKSSFTSVTKTLIHIWDAESIWLSRLQGIPVTTWPSKEFNGNTESACAGWLLMSRNLEEYINALGEADLQKQIAYLNIKGDPFISTVEQMVSHCMNHSTFHRGQLITLLRGAGFDQVGTTDLIAFYREQS